MVDYSSRTRTSSPAVVWRRVDGAPVSCREKLTVLEDNLAELRQVCQDAFEDAVLMGCDPKHVRAVFADVIETLSSPAKSPTVGNAPNRR